MNEELTARVKKLRDIKESISAIPAEKLAKLHERGKLTARERIDGVIDPGTFVELYMLAGQAAGNPRDGIICGYGKIDGRTACIFAQDATVQGGSMGGLHTPKMCELQEYAVANRVPIIGMWDSPGVRAQRVDQERPGAATGPTMSRAAFNNNPYFYNTQASGVIPQISALLGSCAGQAVYSPALTDFIFMVDGISHACITGPRIVKSVSGEDLTLDQLGGARIHAQTSGVADFRMRSEKDCFVQIKKLLGYLPSHCGEKPPVKATADDPERMDNALDELVPAEPNKPYDMHRLIKSVVDDGEFLEVKAQFAGEMITGFGRLNGMPIGIVANQPMVRAGSLTIDGSRKQARFIRFCDCFNIPLLFLIDTPAYLPGSAQEHGGIITHGAKVLYALCEASVPRVNVLVRKLYGGGRLGMGVIPGFGADFNFAWPTLEDAVLGAEQTVELFHAEELAKAANPDQLRQELAKKYRDRSTDPIAQASRSTNIHDIIEPRETRPRLIQAFGFLQGKKVDASPYARKHGNLPL